MNSYLNDKFYNFSKKRKINYLPISAEELKAIRKLYDLSQSSFAQMLGINVRTLQDYELGRIRPSQTANALFNFAKLEIKLFLKYRQKGFRTFER